MLSSQFEYFSIVGFHILVHSFFFIVFTILDLLLIFVVNLSSVIKLVLSFFRKLIYFLYIF